MLRPIVLALLIASFSVPVVALPPSNHEAHNRPSPEHIQEAQAWFKSTVYPSLSKWHSEYDASLSAQDLATLNDLRAKAKSLKQRLISQAKQLRQQGSSKQDMRRAMHELREGQHDAMFELIEQVRPIVERSKAKLVSIFETNKATIQGWREEAKTKFQGGLLGELGFMKAGKKKAALRFVLWDGTMPEPLSRESFNGKQSTSSVMDADAQSGALSVAPNPSGTTARVSVTGVTDGPVTVEVLDMNGVRVATHTATATNGKLEATIPTSELADGTYMVTVNTPAGRRSTTLLVNR